MAYSVDGHRHLPEITQELDLISDRHLGITFLTHLIPMTRGILSTSYAKLRPGGMLEGENGKARLRELYHDYFDTTPFVRVVDRPPQTKQTSGNNLCLIYPTLDVRTDRLVVISCLDNLVKGAAGQAVQNMNLMYGYPEEMSLEPLAIYP